MRDSKSDTRLSNCERLKTLAFRGLLCFQRWKTACWCVLNTRICRQKSSSTFVYPLARNQYINNSPGVFSCIRAGANTGATCIRPEIISLKSLAHMQKMAPQKYFPAFARVRTQAPHVFAKKLIPQEIFPACIGFVPGGTVKCGNHLHVEVHAKNGSPRSTSQKFLSGTPFWGQRRLKLASA